MDAHGISTGRRFWIAASAVCLVNVLLHALCLPYLPDMLPAHWNAEGMADALAPKEADFAFSLLPACVLLVLGLAERFGLSGKASAKALRGYRRFVLVFTLWLSALTWMGELSYAGVLFEGAALLASLFLGAGIIFLCLARILPDLPRNRFAGVRTAAALESPEVWKSSQRVGGHILAAEGVLSLALAGAAFLAPELVETAGIWIFLAAVIAGSCASALYSWACGRRQER